MIDIAVLIILIALVGLHTVIHYSYSAIRKRIQSNVKEWRDADSGDITVDSTLQDMIADISLVSAQVVVSINTNRYAIMVDIICAAAQVVLMALNHVYGVPH